VNYRIVADHIESVCNLAEHWVQDTYCSNPHYDRNMDTITLARADALKMRRDIEEVGEDVCMSSLDFMVTLLTFTVLGGCLGGALVWFL
jgi:hypothetical protein